VVVVVIKAVAFARKDHPLMTPVLLIN
jgi:hypothetical protein